MFNYECIYADLDLKRYEPLLDGQTIRLLQNPTRKFRREFASECFKSATPEWMAMLCVVFDCTEEHLGELLDEMPAEIFHWLLIPHMKDREDEAKPLDLDKDVIWPFIFTVWDEYVDARVKAHAGR